MEYNIQYISVSFLCLICFSLALEAQSINSLEDVELNGQKQKILIQSEDITKPILLYLHGGPGMTSMLTSYYYTDALKEQFIFVDWDQRGAGYSYNDGIDVDSMTIDQFIDDTKALTEYLINRFDKQKIFLVGHSWGSLIGMKAAVQYPEYFYSFIGIGQAIHLKKSEDLCYKWLYQELVKANDTVGLKLIEETHFADRGLITKYDGIFNTDVDLNKIMGTSALLTDEYIQLYQKGLGFSIECLFASQVMHVDFFSEIKTLKVPVYFLQGRFDRIFDSSLLTEFIKNIEAPRKEIVWFENSGHFPNFDEPKLFQDALIKIKKDNFSRK